MKKFISLTVLLISISAHSQDHGHLNIGASSWDQGSKLTFANGGDFLQSIGYVKTLGIPTNPKYAGFYDGNITLTALSYTNGLGEAVPGSPAPGSLIEAQIVSVSGPEGGAFNFWDADSTAGNPTFTIPTGSAPANAKFIVSEVALGAGSPGGDPFGHIHGRRLSATKPGIYTVEFRAFDISTNGVNGGPIHAPSDPIKIDFQADYNIKSITWTENVAQVTIGTRAGYSFTVQSNTNIADTAKWTDVNTVTGNDLFQTIADGTAEPVKFYRVQVSAIAP
jgi:hypothetical protein